MSEKFQDQYRISSIRLSKYDYNSCGAYFVTICLNGKKCSFGNIHNKQIQLNDIGKEAQAYWQQIPKYFPHTEIDQYIFMPDHMHGIIIINNHARRDAIYRVSYNNKNNQECHRVLYNNKNNQPAIITKEKNPMTNNSLSTIIRWYKGRTSFEINKTTNNKFQWQSRFYEHIIRDNQDLRRVQEYIKNNPKEWSLNSLNK